MNEILDKTFGRTIACACGKTHTISPRRIVYADGAMAQLPDICAEYCAGRRVAVLMDVRTRQVAGAEAMSRLSHAAWSVQEVVVPDTTTADAAGQEPRRAEGKESEDSRRAASPVCDDITKESLAGRLDKVDLIVSTGAGVINDLGKWLAFDCGVPFVTFATAASMNGYTSANVAPTVAGVKTLLRARPPVAVLADPQILRDAPYELTAAGLGDVLAKSVSSCDWLLNHQLFGDYYCAESVGLIAQIEPMYLDHPADMLARRPAAIEALFSALLLTGAAMTMAESSAPSSGGEHMISHTLDMMSSLDGRPHDLHGRQVGVGTILASEIYRRVLAIDQPRFVAPPAGVDRSFWGKLADNVAGEYAKKADRMHIAAEKLASPGAWDELRKNLRPLLRSPQTIRDCLKLAGAACSADQIGCTRDRLRSALLHAHEIRSRFTILDLARMTGSMPAAVDALIDEWT